MTDGFSQRTPQQALAALLERFTPQRLLLVGTRFPALDAFARIDAIKVNPEDEWRALLRHF